MPPLKGMVLVLILLHLEKEKICVYWYIQFDTSFAQSEINTGQVSVCAICAVHWLPCQHVDNRAQLFYPAHAHQCS